MTKDSAIKLSSIELFGLEYCPPFFSIERFWTEQEEGYRWPNEPHHPPDEVLAEQHTEQYQEKYEDEIKEYEMKMMARMRERDELIATYNSAECCFQAGDYQRALNLLKECDQELKEHRYGDWSDGGFEEEFIDDRHPYNKSTLNGILGNIEEAVGVSPPLPDHSLGEEIDKVFTEAADLYNKGELVLAGVVDDRLVYDVSKYSNYGTLCFKQTQEIAEKNPQRRALGQESRSVFESLYKSLKNYPRFRATEFTEEVRSIVSFNLACLVLLGAGGSKDPEKAEKLFREVSNCFPKAKFNLGVMKSRGWGVPRDYIGAATMFYEAALDDVPRAEDALELCKEYLPVSV